MVRICGYIKLIDSTPGLMCWVQFYISPVALTTGVFSMQKEFLPFVKPNVGWFLTLVFIFGFLSLTSHRAVTYIATRPKLWSRVSTSPEKITVAVSGLISRRRRRDVRATESDMV
jgi:hypothetical protein